jgi:hypothetical protein
MGDSTPATHHNQLTSWVDIEGLSFGHEKSHRMIPMALQHPLGMEQSIVG